ncbi:MAG: hypothetical protein H7066_20795 [Cytophagaceae bacterium]|nr:hypothetical protein [Gemmatimonadaceae bacterium]
MIRSALAALLLFVLHASLSPSRGGMGAGARVDERIARPVEVASSDAPGLAERAGVQGFARSLVERRSSGSGAGSAPNVWRAESTKRQAHAPRASHGGAHRTRRVPWPHHVAPYQAMAPPDGVFLQ